MLSPRMQPSAWVLKSRLGQLAGARAHRAVSARARGLHPGAIRALGSSLPLVLIEPSGARPQGLHPGQVAPWAARWRSCSSRGQRTSAPGDVFFANTPRAGCERNASIKKRAGKLSSPLLNIRGSNKGKKLGNMRLLLTCPQGQVSGEKGRRHLLTRPWGRISATPHKTWFFPLTCPSSFLRPWGNFWLALSVTAAPCQRLGCRLGRPLGNVPPGRSGPEGRAK